jgi:hypothetical protein
MFVHSRALSDVQGQLQHHEGGAAEDVAWYNLLELNVRLRAATTILGHGF